MLKPVARARTSAIAPGGSDPRCAHSRSGRVLVTSPPAVYGNAVIVVPRSATNRATDVERGVIRAYDAHSGAQLCPSIRCRIPLAPGGVEWTSRRPGHRRRQRLGVMSVDEEHGLVLVPTGSASPDFTRHALGCQSLRGLAARARCQERPARLAAATHPPRPVGLRLAAQPVLGTSRCREYRYRQSSRRQDRHVVRVERTRGRPLFPITEKPCREPMSGRTAGPRSRSRRSRAYCPASAATRRRLGPHVLGSRQVPRPHRLAAQRGHFHPPDTRGTLLSPVTSAA